MLCIRTGHSNSILLLGLICAAATPAAADESRLPVPVLGPEQPLEASKAPGDTTYRYGGPLSIEGTFQTAGGVPDPQGWTSVDRTERENHWNVSQVGSGPFDGYEAGLAPPDGSLIPGAPFLLGALGETVAALGDINGDGWMDLAASYRNGGGPERGALVYLGSEDPDPVPDMVYAELPDGLTNAFGKTIAGAGDVNDDGYDDVLVGNPTTLQSSVSLYFGGSTPDNRRVDHFLASAFMQEFGRALSSAGDVDGDGADDFLIAGRSATLGDFVALQLGGSTGLGSSYLLQEDEVDPGFGTSLCSVGDVNGDGYDDVLVGHPDAASGRGRAYLYLGGFLGSPTVSMVFTGPDFSDGLGTSVAGPGDVNGDGYDDFLIGVPGHEVNGIPRGAVYLYFGGATLDQDPAFILPGIDHNDRYGTVVAALGDLNADGFADFISADPFAGTGGESFVVFGGASIPELKFEPFVGTISGQELGARLASAVGFHAMGSSILMGIAGAGPASGAKVFHAWPTSLPGNHRIRCGLDVAPAGWVNGSGYGDDWDEAIHLYHDVANAGISTDVRIRFIFDLSIELSYDFFTIEMVTASGISELANYSGSGANVILDESFEYLPAEYVINPETGNPSIHARLRLKTDAIGSDEDGMFDSENGAVAVDHLSLWVDDELVSHAAWEPVAPKIVPGDLTFDGSDHGGWAGSRRFFFGDFAKLVSGFIDLDPAVDDLSPQWSFLDDGTPPANDPLGLSTEGSFSTNWDYGVPSGAVVNFTGGVSNAHPSIWNEIRSPEIPWDNPSDPDDQNFVDAEIVFDVYRHLPFDNGLFYYWGVRSRVAGAWSEWSTVQTVYFWPDPQYARVALSMAGHVPPTAEAIQVRLGVQDLHEQFELPGGDATPAPLFDDVAIRKIYEATTAAATPVGSDVTVSLGDATLTFDSVEASGTSSVIVQNESPNPLGGFSLATDPARYYEVQTDATWSGNVEVCLRYNEIMLTIPEIDLRIRHWQDTASGPAWVDVTSSHDLDNNIICANVSSLSPFVLVAKGSVVGAPAVARTSPILHPAYPNPFNPRTRLSFSLAEPGLVELDIYDSRGRRIKKLIATHYSAGTHRVEWDGTDEAGNRASSGVYLAHLVVDGRPSGSAVRLTLVK